VSESRGRSTKQVPQESRVVVGLAGRRIDVPNPDVERFPLSNVELVRQRLHDLFRQERPATLVSSAACGADLIALEEAMALGIRRRVVLPCRPERFRLRSVIDRPGDWGPVFDRITDDAISNGDLIVLEDRMVDDRATYEATNQKIIDEARNLTELGGIPLAVVVWEGASRGDDDLTVAFGREAASKGLRVVHVSTL
jgi:hypothetical protein